MTKRLCSLLIVAWTTMIGVAKADATSRATSGFEKLQTLVGDWEGKDEQGVVVKTSFKLIAGHTAVAERSPFPAWKKW